MAEGEVHMSSNGLDRQSTLLRNIRMISSIMEEVEAAGYEDFANDLSSLRSDLLVVAGMSSSYDPRDPEAVRRDLYENGDERIRDLIERANEIK
ncbi:MAG: hypothetical protein MK052_10125 [Alphaproteobacteria bacterium]|nr:hypothetical protein [Alphaproteobacteria bacterium]